MNKKKGNYTKKLISTCDDMLFMSGEIILSYNPQSSVACIDMDLDLQVGSTAKLREDEIQCLINNLQTFLDRVKHHKVNNYE